MSDPAANFFHRGVRLAGAGLQTLVVWSLWLVLLLALAAQVYVASSNELEVPRFLQRALEARLDASGVRATFGRTHFDPTGRIVVENVQLQLPGFAESLVSARAIMGRVNLWALLADRFEPVEVQVTGLSLRVPAMLSASGADDEIVRDVDAGFVPRGDQLEIEYLTAHLGTMPVAMQGTIPLAAAAWARPGPAPLPLAELLARKYPQVSRQCDAAIAQLAAFDRPILQLRLTAANGGAGTAQINFGADAFKTAAAAPARLKGLSATGEVSFGGADPVPVALVLRAQEGTFPGPVELRQGTAWIEGDLAWQDPSGGLPRFRPRSLRAVADRIAYGTLVYADPVVRLELAAQPKMAADLLGLLWGQPVAIAADGDWSAGTARVRFAGALAPALLDFIGERTHNDLRPIISYVAPVQATGEAQFGPAWAFQRVSARVALTGLTAKRVTIDEARGVVEFDGRVLRAPEAYARLGADSARGSFTEDVSTHDYRFLLSGRLRPLDITPWIAGAWWPDFFGNFAFPAEPLAASADLQGCFTNPRKFAAFIDVAAAQPAFHGVTVDHLHTRLFARPQFTDGLEFQVARGGGTATGTFVRHFDLTAGALQSVDLVADSTLELGPLGPMLGDSGAPFLQPFFFAQAPHLLFNGHFDGKAAPGGAHDHIQVAVRTDAPFRYFDFPVDQISFQADVRDNDVTITNLEAGVAGGTLTGKARVAGNGPDRRLEFDAGLNRASLGRAIAVVQQYAARRAGRAPTPAGKIIQEKNNVRVDGSISAVGRFSDPLSFAGAGNIVLQGEEIGQIRMLGLLSELLPFTALRFTTARANFRVDGSRLIFSEVNVTGANSALVASGAYALDRSQLDFKVRVNPFQESKSFPQKFMDAVLTPLSSALEVRLTGSLDKPKWAFVNGPTNFLRNLGPVAPASSAASLYPRSPLAAPPRAPAE
jgi:hypothetical protein